MANKVEKVNFFTRIEITRHEKLQRSKELYIDFLDQNNHEKFSTFSPDANKYILDIFNKYSPNQIRAFRKYVGIRERKGKRTSSSTPGVLKNKKLHDYARLGLMFEKTTKELLIILNHHKTIDFQKVVPVKGHGTNVSYLKPDIVINGDIWIDCKLTITSNLKETSLKYEGYARVLEFYVLISEGIRYGVDERSGQIVRSIWDILERGRYRLGEVGFERFSSEFKALEDEFYLIKNNID